jgi:hypothetical protein
MNPPPGWRPVFLTADSGIGVAVPLRSNGRQWIMAPLEPGECRVYRADAAA